ncbi:hypothetical protein SPRG_05581 [Saprolegnia parasitica CBS 223.65]|uniref:Uncharacterized protein n=1 Tax=Saprolegnia parasitica (strain CBS 223.65) TaxID=695850 RepID=A0A067CGK6_SAPPC|nr:hypothetical protein SPRG_05581 [Saprolegnia parasitica CBS 223.65]KDO29628.1 hypothetical protein SPRG_05581 [Saprolegnia parasitica CBS 223.65]|eukprot:XP_012199688.1 hypothetical protein SPRG_05581 [Saprolegnia parasitica CBS 223.65]
MASNPNSVLVKAKAPWWSLGWLAAISEKYAFRDKINRVLVVIAYVIGVLVVVLVAIDAICNNWAIIDFVGDGNEFITPVANTEGAADLVETYAFRHGGDLASLSSIGLWMTNYTIANLGALNSDIYLLSTSEFEIDARINICSRFSGNYSVDLAAKNPFKLGVAFDLISFLRGSSITIAFTDEATSNLGNRSMGSAELQRRGYAAARLGADVRLTQFIKLENTSNVQVQIVPVWEIFAKGYCTGCIPIAELGRGSCNFSMTYTDANKTLNVLARPMPGSLHRHGLLIRQNSFSTASHWIKFIALFFAAGGYLASRRTVQWLEVDPTKPDTIFTRALQTVVPKCFPHLSHALRFDMFCYNSDLFVTLFCISIILDMQSSLIFIREVNVYNAIKPQFIMSVRLFSLSLRLLWLNCGILKLCKIGLSVVSTATYCGESRFMGFFNLTSVTSLYLSAILLFYIPDYIEYNNSVRQDLFGSVENLDGTPVSFYDSFYFRVSYAIVIGLIANILLITLLDQVVNRPFWKLMARNSLGRQALFNSTSILCDYISDVREDKKHRAAIIICKARRLSTLQWFFMTHMFTFGLPEKELRVKAKFQPTTQGTTAAGETGPGKEMCMVVQDGNCHIHLLDDQLADVKSLVYNIKVLKDTTVVIK